MITVICGTNRPNSLSLSIAHYYSTLLTELGAAHQVLDLAALPTDFTASALYHNNGKNTDFNTLTVQIKASDKFVFIVPEYNGSYPGVLKAFIDGLPYPSPFDGKVAALVGLSAGMQGAGPAMSHLTDVFNYLNMNVLAIKPKMAFISKHWQNNQLTNPLYVELLQKQAALLVAH
jgi:NAD(P)H-dependent FMN reductase